MPLHPPRKSALLAALVLASCATGGAPPPPLEVGAGQAATVLNLTLGQHLIVRLPSNPSTGFNWNATDPAAGLLHPDGEPRYLPNAVPPGMVGAGGVMEWRFRATDRGTGNLRFEYKRPWEERGLPAQVVSYGVRVQ